MASIFKRGRDKHKKRAPWHFEYTDHLGKRRTEKGVTNKSKTEQLAAKRESDARERSTGLIDADKEKLRSIGMATTRSQLDEFQKRLEAKDVAPKHIKLMTGRVTKVLEGCQFKTVGDLNRDRAENSLFELRQQTGFGNRTFNHYVQAIEQLARREEEIDHQPFPRNGKTSERCRCPKEANSLVAERAREIGPVSSGQYKNGPMLQRSHTGRDLHHELHDSIAAKRNYESGSQQF